MQQKMNKKFKLQKLGRRRVKLVKGIIWHLIIRFNKNRFSCPDIYPRTFPVSMRIAHSTCSLALVIVHYLDKYVFEQKNKDFFSEIKMVYWCDVIILDVTLFNRPHIRRRYLATTTRIHLVVAF